MDNTKKLSTDSFERTIKEYLKQGREKLDKELTGTREAIKIIAREKTRDFIQTMDKGLTKEERDYLSALIVTSMYQSFLLWLWYW